MRMSHAPGSGGAPTTPPGRTVSNIRGIRDCILPSDYERRVLITRKYAGIRVVDRRRFPKRLFFRSLFLKLFHGTLSKYNDYGSTF